MDFQELGPTGLTMKLCTSLLSMDTTRPLLSSKMDEFSLIPKLLVSILRHAITSTFNFFMKGMIQAMKLNGFRLSLPTLRQLMEAQF